ncbi:hypothetical protein GCM10009603_67020 [Nocardiopsis exhalans]
MVVVGEFEGAHALGQPGEAFGCVQAGALVHEPARGPQQAGGSPPPVQRPGSREMRMEPASAKASVTMASAIPLTRSDTAPRIRASRVPPTTETRAAHSRGSSSTDIRSAAA